MKHYLIDGTNLSRGRDYDPRFPAMEERRAQELVDRVARLAERLGALGEVELFFDGPARPVGDARPARLRFSNEREADELIQGKVRLLRSQNSGVTVATEDGGLARDCEAEGAKVIGGGGLWRLCAD